MAAKFRSLSRRGKWNVAVGLFLVAILLMAVTTGFLEARDHPLYGIPASVHLPDAEQDRLVELALSRYEQALRFHPYSLDVQAKRKSQLDAVLHRCTWQYRGLCERCARYFRDTPEQIYTAAMSIRQHLQKSGRQADTAEILEAALLLVPTWDLFDGKKPEIGSFTRGVYQGWREHEGLSHQQVIDRIREYVEKAKDADGNNPGGQPGGVPAGG